MKFTLHKKTKIYICSPANIDTGGPTDLHQLAFILKKKFNRKVYMSYYPLQKKNPIHKNYKLFKIPFVKKIPDLKENILIIPEAFYFIKLSRKYSNIQKGLWWLSIDNYLKHRFVNKNNRIIQILIKIPHKIYVLFSKITSFQFKNITFFKYLKFIYINLSLNNVFKIENIKVNLVHSKYQFNVLKSKKIKSVYLSDYIRDEYFKKSRTILLKKKKNIICYNPSKSTIFFQKFIKLNPDIKFFPLTNLSLSEMITALSRSKIYMDFGFHPGQDHLPREAAILKNCIITNKEGSAAIYDDLPIKDEFKFYEKKENFYKIRKKIDLVFNNFSRELIKFQYYRHYLHRQKNLFENQIEKIFS